MSQGRRGLKFKLRQQIYSTLTVLWYGLTENIGRENDGPSKSLGPSEDQIAGHENAGHEDAGHEIAEHGMTDQAAVSTTINK